MIRQRDENRHEEAHERHFPGRYPEKLEQIQDGQAGCRITA
ncbi:hypothetical protein LINPERHAP2_LOCUS10000 [Linum perenne]